MVRIVLKRSITWWHVAFGVVCIVVALLTLIHSQVISDSLIKIYAVIAVMKGITEILPKTAVLKTQGLVSKISIGLGLFDILIGLVLLFDLARNLIVLPVVFAIWFVVDALLGLVLAGELREYSQAYYKIVMVSCVIGVLTGCLLFFNPMISLNMFHYLIGTYLLLLGVSNISYVLVG